MSLTRSHADAEDLVQETFTRAIPGLKRLRNHDYVRGWLLTIQRNIWFNELRRRRAAPQFLASTPDADIFEFIPGNARGPYEICENLSERQHLRKSIHRLPAKLREIILLREYEDLSYRDIAVLLGCPMGTVMSRLKRAREKLRYLLSQ